jgi:hypothetical protein
MINGGYDEKDKKINLANIRRGVSVAFLCERNRRHRGNTGNVQPIIFRTNQHAVDRIRSHRIRKFCKAEDHPWINRISTDFKTKTPAYDYVGERFLAEDDSHAPAWEPG